MKISIGMKDAAPVVPDYAMLKAALVAAQASTPTARANGTHLAPADPHAALEAIFGSDKSLLPFADALGCRFNIDAPTAEDGA